MTDDKMTRQLELEQEMKSLGITRYRQITEYSKERGEETRTDYGRRLMRLTNEPVAKAMGEFVVNALEGKKGRRNIAAVYLNKVDFRVASLITSKAVLDSMSGEVRTAQSVGLKIGQMLEDEVRFQKFAEEDPKLWRKVNKSFESDHARHRRAVIVYRMNNHSDVEWEEWPKTDKLHLGMKCLELFCEVTGLAEVSLVYGKKNKSSLYVRPTPQASKWVEEWKSKSELLLPTFLPTIIPPKKWENAVGGGYYSSAIRPLRLVKTNNWRYIEELNNRVDDMPLIYSAINAVQETPWRVNTQVLDVMSQVWDAGLSVGKLPPHGYYEVPPSPVPRGMTKDNMSDKQKEDFQKWKKEAHEIHAKNSKLTSKQIQAAKILSIASKFKDEPEIYFPMQYDWRLRMYSVPMFFNPQGSDISKGLLQFAVGKKLGTDEAVDWLAIHGANLWGYDKVSYEDRILWAHMRSEDVLAYVSDPMEHRGWMDADEPFQFLAWCYEWAGYLEQGKEWVSRIPIALDGSCNGLQHYSAMLRDPVGGKSVNLIPSEVPEDIYQDVADVTIVKLRQEAFQKVSEEDAQLAQQWLDFGISRKTTKRAVMVLPYGGTFFACRQYVQQHLEERIESGEVHPFGEDNIFRASNWLANRVWAAISEVVLAAMDGMDWLQKTARVLTKHGVPIVWTTPDGAPIMQAYPSYKNRKVTTKFGDSVLQLHLREEQDELDAVKQRNAIAPNFVHSMDGTALRMCVSLSRDNGVDSFAMIHDSYGTHAADTDIMAQALRVSFVELYEREDVLEKFRDEVSKMLSEDEKNELPEMPKKGDLDIRTVLDSPFFFA